VRVYDALKTELHEYLFRTTKHGTFKNHVLILNMPDSVEAVYSLHQHSLVSCGQKMTKQFFSVESVFCTAMSTSILRASVQSKSIKLNLKNRLFFKVLVLSTASILFGSLGFKANAEPLQLSSQPASLHALALQEEQLQDAALHPVDLSVPDLAFSTSDLPTQGLQLTVASPQTVAQAAVEAVPEAVGQSPSLRTEPTTPNELPFQPKKELLQSTRRYSPSITYLTPSAYGKSLGQFSVGGSFQGRVRYSTESDAFMGGGFGLGDPRKVVGLDVSIGIADVTTFERGTIGFKIHRRLPRQFAIAVGVDNAITWGIVDGDISPYGVVTKAFQLREDPQMPFSQLYVSGGAGTGRYRSEGDIINHRDTVGVFGSIAVRVIERVNFITEWSGQDLTLGVSILPFPKIPLVFNPAVTDVTGTAGDGPRFTFGVGFGFSF
jgi:hypothetical protein